jgi:hypothetical protein
MSLKPLRAGVAGRIFHHPHAWLTPDICHDFGLAAESRHVLCRLLGSRGSRGFRGSGGVAVRVSLWAGQVFGEGYEGLGFEPQTIVLLIHEENCKGKCKQHQWNAVAVNQNQSYA